MFQFQVKMLKLALLLVLVPGLQCTLTAEEIQIMIDSGIDVIDNEDHWTFEHHGIPLHGFEGGFGDNPNEPSAQNYSFDIPKEAVVASEKGCVRLGPIGMSLSGAPFYNPYTGQGKNAVEGDCQETFDDCSGHPSPHGAYHYHKLPACIYIGILEDKFLGVAFDGYPIYGPLDRTGRNVTSADLDACHGHMYSGRYIYRITYDFPYILGCYHGEPLEVGMIMGGGGGPPGDRPPPPPQGRRRRDVANAQVQRYKRQIPGSDNPCTEVEDSLWQQETCYAFCENPADGSRDDCIPPGQQTTQSTSETSQPTTGSAHSTISTPEVTETPSSATTEDDVSKSAKNVVPVTVFLCSCILYLVLI